jgi:hypothetical protein
MDDPAFKNVRVRHKLLTTRFWIASRLPTTRKVARPVNTRAFVVTYLSVQLSQRLAG